MKKAIVVLVVFLVLFGTMLPSAAWARGGWRGGHRGGHGVWWWPGAIIGGLALGAVAIVTAPILALSAAPVYPAPSVYPAPPTYPPPPTYAAAPTTYQQAPIYAPPQAPAVQRVVVYPNGRYVLYGDGVYHPWQWVWMPSAWPPPPPPPPQQ